MLPKILVISDYSRFDRYKPEPEIFLALAKTGYPITVMTPGDCFYAKRFREAGVEVIDFLPKKKLNRSEIKTIRQTILDKEIEVLHLFSSKGIINGIQAAKNTKAKVILYRGLVGNVHWYDPTAYWKYLHPRVDKIICNAEGVEEHFHRQLFFDKSKTITIHKGHDIDWYSSIKPIDIRSQLNIPKDAFLLVNNANNRKMKGIPYLLKAMKLLPQDLPIYLLILGNGMDIPKNKKIINSLSDLSKVRILGYRKDALNIVAAADVFVLPSIRGESLTKAGIEAMSLSIAPLITMIPGNRDLIIDKESGVFVPPKSPDALAKEIQFMFENRQQTKQFGQKAKERIDRVFNIKKTVTAYKKLYVDIFKY